MYPGGELTRLALRKELLRARIAVRREQCAVAASELARPLAWVDHMIDKWRTISPLARVVGLPVAVVMARKLMPLVGQRKWLTVAQMLPMVMRAVRAYSRART